jgi:hypothetical protein
MMEDVIFYLARFHSARQILESPKGVPAVHPLRRDLEIQNAKLKKMLKAHMVKYLLVEEPTKAQRKAMGEGMHRIHQQSKRIDAMLAEVAVEHHLAKYPDRVRQKRLLLTDVKKQMKEMNDRYFVSWRERWRKGTWPPPPLGGRGLEGIRKMLKK